MIMVRMWKIIVFVLMAFASVSGATDYDCDQHSYLTCEINNVPAHFPATGKELHHSCKIEINFLKCVIRNEENCNADPDFIRIHKELLAATKDMCNKDNPKHSVIVDNLACVKPIFEDNSVECYHSYPGHKKAKKYAKALRAGGLSPFTKNKESRKDCLRGLYVFVCEALKIEEKCGSHVMEAFIKIIHTRTMPLTDRCNPKVKHDLMEIVRIVKIEQMKEDLEEDTDEDK